jgi:hypothetical protein
MRQGRGRVTRDATWRHEVGEGPGPTDRRWAASTNPVAVRTCGRSTLRQGRAGVADRWPRCYSAGRRARELAADTWAPHHSTGDG